MEMKDKILDSAQKLVQQRGFNGFSYADIAQEVGIRKASLHHHFPAKTDLGQALIIRYTAQLKSELLNITGTAKAPEQKLEAYIGLYRGAFDIDRMCLGGMLASEAHTLDPAILPNLEYFFIVHTEWLTALLSEGESKQIFSLNNGAAAQAKLFLSSLQGALLIARATHDVESFEQTTSSLILNLMRKS